MTRERLVTVSIHVPVEHASLANETLDGKRNVEVVTLARNGAADDAGVLLHVRYGWVVGANKHDVRRRARAAGVTVLSCEQLALETRERATLEDMPPAAPAALDAQAGDATPITPAEAPAEPEVAAPAVELAAAAEAASDALVHESGREGYDRTQLRARGLGYTVHRDYAAHFFRWGFARRWCKKVRADDGSGWRRPKVLDVGCGQDLALLRVIRSYPQGDYIPELYVGVDLNPLEKFWADGTSADRWCKLHERFSFVDDGAHLVAQYGQFDLVTCFEVIEHMPVDAGAQLLRQIRDALAETGVALLSTPVFNGSAAANHVHEYTAVELHTQIVECGLEVTQRFGTFASYPDMKRELLRDDVGDDEEWSPLARREQLATLNKVRAYYSDEVAACFLAPLYPDASRNNVWVLRRATSSTDGAAEAIDETLREWAMRVTPLGADGAPFGEGTVWASSRSVNEVGIFAESGAPVGRMVAVRETAGGVTVSGIMSPAAFRTSAGLSGPRFMDVENLAGTFTLGAVRAGWELAGARRMPGAFGLACVEDNRHLLPGAWEAQVGQWQEWEPEHGLGAIFATPPCAGFSALSRHLDPTQHGVNARQNACMHAVIDYAARCGGYDGGRGPEMVIFESVRNAGTNGRPLMQLLREKLSAETGQSYALTHVFQTHAWCGGAQRRPRYFFVAHRIPFAVGPPLADPEHTTAHAIADLRGMGNAWAEQPYAIDGANPGATRRRADGMVDSHTWKLSRSNTAWLTVWDAWPEGWLAKKLYDEQGEDDPNLVRLQLQTAHDAAGLLPRWREDRPTWFGGPARLAAGSPCRTITGSGGAEIFHYSEPRPLSVRECGRLMGMPDSWSYRAARSVGQAYSWIGKSLPLQPAEWVATYALASLIGAEAGERYGGETVGEDEYVVRFG